MEEDDCQSKEKNMAKEESATDAKEQSEVASSKRAIVCKKTKQILCAVFLGQLLAILLAASGIFIALLAEMNLSLPLAQMYPQYALGGVISGVICAVRYCKHRQSSSTAPSPGACTTKKLLLYTLSGVVDLHAFWATLTAYVYSNVASIQILDCVSIPTSMLLSFLLLQHRYSWPHYLGALVCIAGAVLMVVADVLAAEKHASTNVTSIVDEAARYEALLGDMLAMSGAILYGVSSVIQEYNVLQCGVMPYLFGSHVVAAILCAIYGAAMEHEHLTEIFTQGTSYGRRLTWAGLVYYLGYIVTMTAFDFLMASSIVSVSAVLINMSFLTCDIYAFLAGIVIFHLKFHFLYFISFAVIIVGVILYAIRDAKPISGVG